MIVSFVDNDLMLFMSVYVIFFTKTSKPKVVLSL